MTLLVLLRKELAPVLFAFFLKVAFEFGDIVVLGGFSFGALHRHFAERGESFGAHLAHDLGKHLGDLLCLGAARDGEGVGVGGRLNLTKYKLTFITKWLNLKKNG